VESLSSYSFFWAFFLIYNIHFVLFCVFCFFPPLSIISETSPKRQTTELCYRGVRAVRNINILCTPFHRRLRLVGAFSSRTLVLRSPAGAPPPQARGERRPRGQRETGGWEPGLCSALGPEREEEESEKESRQGRGEREREREREARQGALLTEG